VDSVPIIGGTGSLGLGLSLRLAQAGVPTVTGSRDASRAAKAAAEVREQVPDAEVEGRENSEAAGLGPVVLLCVPYAAQGDNLAALADAMSAGQVLLDATVPLEKGKLVEGAFAAGSARELLPAEVEVVSGLHTVSAVKLKDLDHALDEDTLLAGDSDDAKHQVASLLRNVPGLRPVDCGPLSNARVIEKLTSVLISVNKRYRAHAGIRLAGLPEELW
jgi:8-hydroxy-5-deazaflavin:NADPH oxidoreductase